MSESIVEVIEHDAIREVRLARAPVNALNDALCIALVEALQQAQRDEVGGVVLSGSERIFSAGLDVPHLLSHGDDRDKLHASWSAFFEVARTLGHAPMPVVAALTGHSPAGGCVLALCCDYRVMARSLDPAQPYAIGLNEVQVGLPVPEGIQRLMRRIVGHYHAERLLVAGQMIPAETAAAIGLVDELVDGAEVVPRAIGWLQRLLKLPRQPMLATRQVARADIREALESQFIQLERFVDAWYGPDTQAALQALAAKLRKN